MIDDKKVQIDKEMHERFSAVRSSVTESDWIDLGNDIWICSYVFFPEDNNETPTLYMVHYVRDRDVYIIYKRI